MKHLFKNCWTIPNALSLLRIILIPVFTYYFLQDRVLLAVIIIAAAAITDLLDGKIARRFNQVSELGKVLDPVADKLSQMAIVIILMIKYSDSAIRY
ncbi:MAG: CDP-alcohol phosphatidyltransferase family protein, partial [Clostridiales bacterium]|nr:CDP-alcohol phosphatidyltransferase family protein [Clostridiales bacterium]